MDLMRADEGLDSGSVHRNGEEGQTSDSLPLLLVSKKFSRT